MKWCPWIPAGSLMCIVFFPLAPPLQSTPSSGEMKIADDGNLWIVGTYRGDRGAVETVSDLETHVDADYQVFYMP